MKRTAWGILAMFAYYLIPTIAAVVRVDLTSYGGSYRVGLYVQMLALLVGLVGMLLIVLGSNHMGALHRRMVRIMLVLLGLTIITQILMSDSVSYDYILIRANSSVLQMIDRVGSPLLAWLEQGSMARQTIENILLIWMLFLIRAVIPFVLAYGLCDKLLRSLLWVAFGLMVLVSFAYWWPIMEMAIRAIDSAGRLFSAETAGGGDFSLALRVFSGIGLISNSLYMIVYGVLMVRLFRKVRSRPKEILNADGAVG